MKIVGYSDHHRNDILRIWERSVSATHDFLSVSDFNEIKEMVQAMDFSQFEVFLAMHQDVVAGFIGLHGAKVEMLFVDPEYFGRGLGKSLMIFAMEEKRANQVDVNEQNGGALDFYQSLGFVTFERSDLDDQGKPYPILRMQFAE